MKEMKGGWQGRGFGGWVAWRREGQEGCGSCTIYKQRATSVCRSSPQLFISLVTPTRPPRHHEHSGN